ncbi:MAG: DUF7003 family protein [Pirellulaceae bacterium]
MSILDDCCESFKFPVLDNGYLYLAATRLSLFRSTADWAMIIEVFGFSPRAGIPHTTIYTFANKLAKRKSPADYVNRQAYENYLANNPHNEYESVFPIKEGAWHDQEDGEVVSQNATEIVVREKKVKLPPSKAHHKIGGELEQPPRVQVFELCRYLAEIERSQVLATMEERRIHVLPEMTELLVLDEWHHPDLCNDELPSESETFQQLAEVLASNDVKAYHPASAANTHWRNWPEGGTL